MNYYQETLYQFVFKYNHENQPNVSCTLVEISHQEVLRPAYT